MLDFYLIEEQQQTPEYPEEMNLKYLGGLEFQSFSKLKVIGIIDLSFSYYNDYRLNLKQVKEILLKMNLSKWKEDLDLLSFQKILYKAIEAKMELIAFCD